MKDIYPFLNNASNKLRGILPKIPPESSSNIFFFAIAVKNSKATRRCSIVRTQNIFQNRNKKCSRLSRATAA